MGTKQPPAILINVQSPLKTRVILPYCIYQPVNYVSFITLDHILPEVKYDVAGDVTNLSSIHSNLE